MDLLPDHVMEKIYSAIKKECDTASIDRFSEYSHFLIEICDAALTYAERSGKKSEFEIDELLDNGISAITDIRRGLRPFGDQSEFNSKQIFWRHREDIVQYVKYSQQSKDSIIRTVLPSFHVYGDGLSYGIGLYLKLPYRSEKLDRIFVDILIASKIVPFLEYHLITVNEPVYSVSEGKKVAKIHPFKRFSFAMLKIIGYGAAIEFTLYLIEQSYRNSFAEIAGVILGYFLLALIAGWVVWLLFGLAKLRVRNDNYKALLPSMLQCYNLPGTSGPVSANQMMEKLKEAEKVGVSWPPSLYALLDDIITRTGRI